MSKPSREDLLHASFAAREAAWATFGTVESDVISHAINPSFMGGPQWPGMRQAYRVAQKGSTVLIASDGLSDPYDEDEGPQDVNGLGLEIFAATDEPIARPGDPSVARFGATWLHDLVFQVSQNAAASGKIASFLAEWGLMSLVVYDVGIPASHAAKFVDSAGRVCVLLSTGASPIPARIDGPLSPILLVHAQLVTCAEADVLAESYSAGRREFANKLVAQKIAPRSRLDRPSVVD